MFRPASSLVFAISCVFIWQATALFSLAEGPSEGFGPPGRGGRGPREIKERPASLKVDLKEPADGLVKNPRFRKSAADKKSPAFYTLQGAATWEWCGAHEYTEAGVALQSFAEANKKGSVSNTASGSVTQRVTGFESGVGRWYRFSFRGLAEKNFSVEKDGLTMRVEYFSQQGANGLDGITQHIYDLVERDRKDLATNGLNFKNGGAVWKTYAMEFRLPFAEIDTMDLSVSFEKGNAKVKEDSEFYATEFSLVPIPVPEGAPKLVKKQAATDSSGRAIAMPSIGSLYHIGGHWYYDWKADKDGAKEPPKTLVVTAVNADRLYYSDGRLSNPFAENMTAWLRKGYLDLKGKRVEKDQFVADNVVLEFVDGKEMVVHARNLPNHPTAIFPGYNPNSIQETDRIYHLPLVPTRNAKAIAMDKSDANHALPMGSIGVAINGVAFFNPFDAGMQEAVNIMDRCCGHPSPDNMYHYHKYPVCVKTPFVEFGEEHSPVIGWAMDGFPIYGPYESKGLMARDDKAHPLDAFNMHFDEERGWHYHVTPGKFPYIIGGFAGAVDGRNMRRGPPGM